MAPVLYCLAKALRVGTGSLYETSRGLRYTFLQNAAHFAQCPLVENSLLVERFLVMLSAEELKLSRKQVYLPGSTVTMAASVGRWFPCGRAVRRQWDIVSGRCGMRFHCLPFSLSRGGGFNGVTTCVLPVVRVGRPVGRLKWWYLSAAATVWLFYLSGAGWLFPVRRNNPTCTHNESRCRPVPDHY